jgi:predicted heme/steroid binding protein
VAGIAHAQIMAPHSRMEEVVSTASQDGLGEHVPRPGKKGGRTFTWEQLATHNTANDAYVGIHGQVYDVTAWMAAHPGGRDVLLVAAGRDVSQVCGCVGR